MPKKFDFPVWVIGTPEQQAAEAERQRLMRASFTRAHQTDAEQLIGRGKLLEETARKHLAQAETPLAKSQLADALAMQGRYAEAVEIHPHPVRKQHFRDVIKALQMDDAAKCTCADSKAEMNGTKLSITPRFESRKLFSPVHNDVVSLIVCSKCGHTNARKARSRLLPQQAALNQSETAKKPVLIDAQVLNAQ